MVGEDLKLLIGTCNWCILHSRLHSTSHPVYIYIPGLCHTCIYAKLTSYLNLTCTCMCIIGLHYCPASNGNIMQCMWDMYTLQSSTSSISLSICLLSLYYWLAKVVSLMTVWDHGLRLVFLAWWFFQGTLTCLLFCKAYWISCPRATLRKSCYGADTLAPYCGTACRGLTVVYTFYWKNDGIIACTGY